jgi:hypothetical protein
LNREDREDRKENIYDAQLLPYPLLYPTARQLNEPTFFLRDLGGLGGSKFKAQPAS